MENYEHEILCVYCMRLCGLVFQFNMKLATQATTCYFFIELEKKYSDSLQSVFLSPINFQFRRNRVWILIQFSREREEEKKRDSVCAVNLCALLMVNGLWARLMNLMPIGRKTNWLPHNIATLVVLLLIRLHSVRIWATADAKHLVDFIQIN